MTSYDDIWKMILDKLGESLTPTSINAFMDDCSISMINENNLILRSPVELKRDVIKNRYISLIKSAIDEIFSASFNVFVFDDEGIASYKRVHDDAKQGMNAIKDFTFENFVVGASNKFAHAAAVGVAENPAGPYNPLFIYGESGLGKTHLLYAIANRIRKNHPEFTIIYKKGDDFTNELIDALRCAKTQEFRERYRQTDLLLVDDIHFIAGKVQTQEEFFNTFNALYESGKQIVLTSDRPPKEMNRLEDRLKTRFEWGLIADIQPPDFETRSAIIRNKAQQLNLTLPDDVVNFIAENVTANVRQIEGTVKKIMAYRDIMFEPINIESVSRAIADMYKEKSEYTYTPEKIITEVANYFRLTPEDLRGKSRSREVVIARQIAMFLIRKLTNFSLENIGTEFGSRDHSTVINSVRKVENAIKSPGEMSDMVKDIEQNLNSAS